MPRRRARSDARHRADRVTLLAGDAQPGQVPEPGVEEELDSAELGDDLAFRVAGAAAYYASLAGADGQVWGNDVEVGTEEDARLAPDSEDVGAAFAQGEDAQACPETPQLCLEEGKGGRLAAGRSICGAELRQQAKCAAFHGLKAGHGGPPIRWRSHGIRPGANRPCDRKWDEFRWRSAGTAKAPGFADLPRQP